MLRATRPEKSKRAVRVSLGGPQLIAMSGFA